MNLLINRTQVGINDDGAAVGYASGLSVFSYYDNVGGNSLSWIWHPDLQDYSFFTAPGAQEASTMPASINNEKLVVGSFSGFQKVTSVAFLKKNCAEKEEDWDDENSRCRYLSFVLPTPDSYTVATGINNKGFVAGWFYSPDANYLAGFIRTPSGLIKQVNEPGFEGTEIFGLSNSGAICGFAFTSSAVQAFVAFPD